MPLDPGTFLTLLDETIAEAEAKRLRKRDLAIILRSPAVLLGQQGRFVGRDEEGAAYAFTLGQCRALRETVLAAAREDARAAGLDV